MTHYWYLKNPDPGMPRWAKRRLEPYLKLFESMIEEASKGAFQSRFVQDTLDASDQRVDFMINIWQQAGKLPFARADELLKQADTRRSSK